MTKKFGEYTIKAGLSVSFRDEKITFENVSEDSYIYQRKNKDEIATKKIFSSKKGEVKIAIYPVRPIQMPQPLAHNILVKLDPPLSLPPNSRVTHHLTMPIEIGVFTISKKSTNMIDAFSLSFPKYALYGQPNMGYICRLHNSTISPEEKTKQFEEAAVIMKFQNKSPNWVTVNKIVMDAFEVDLYLDGDKVYLEDSDLEIGVDGIPSLILNNKPPLRGLKEVPAAAETVKKFRRGILERTGFGVKGKFIMEHGY